MSWLFASGGQRGFSFNISPFNEYLGLISFRVDWFDLLSAQGTLKSLLQPHSSKTSILQHSAFFMVQLSHPYMTTGKTIALTSWIFVSKVMSLLFNMLFKFVIAFLPKNKHLLILWLQPPSAVILEPKKIKSVTVSILSPSICHKVMGLDAMILVFWMLSFKPAFSLSSFTFIKRFFQSVVTQSRPTASDPMDWNTKGFPVHHQPPELAQTHIHQATDATQPFHPWSHPSPPATNLSQLQGLFPWASSLCQVAKILEFQFQHQSFQWIFRTDFL